MTPFLPFHVPSLGDEELQSIADTLNSGWLTTGKKTQQFEQEFAQRVGAKFAIAVNSCTAALHLALATLGLEEDDEVIVPTMTFAATAEVVTYFKGKPVLVDICPRTFNIDANLLEHAITAKTKAIIPVHFAGQPCEMNQIMKIAQSFDLRVIEDAAHALPAQYHGKTVGTIGDLTCFSFYATKTITTGEGGMITTENPTWAERIRMLSLHGITRNAIDRYTATGSWYYEIRMPGYKYNLSDVAAALGVPQLRKCDSFWEIRSRYAMMYTKGFRDVPEITTPSVNDGIEHAWHLYVIQLNLERLRVGRDQIIEELKQHGIGTSVHFIPLHLHPYYRTLPHCDSKNFSVANAVFKRIISLPIYPKMTEADVYRVIEALTELVQRYRR